ncbi:MAG: hypothetical protein MJA83_11385 [Gammaproteobacteria bacterium]|nr:hypothetical protein [Gammaproteobacteria bacterium]
MANGFLLLDQLIRQHNSLKIDDHKVVQDLCEKLALQEEHGFINSYICEQPSLEAQALYLLGRYEALYNRLKAIVAEYRADKTLTLGSKDDEGFKWTKQSKEEWLLATDTKYLEKVERLRNVENLYTLIKGLYQITISRDDKLQHLSNNYRRELKGNER